MTIHTSILSLSIIFVLTSTAFGQANPKPLTNSEIAKMIAAGLPESTILQVIQKGPPAFDTSPDALIRLKQHGATPRIMDAMLGGLPTNAEPSRHVSGAVVPTVSITKGVFFESSSGSKRIEEVSPIEARAVGGIASQLTFGLKEQRMILVFRGEHAEVQTTDRRPVFRISGLGASTRDVYIVSLRPNPDRRDLEIARSGLLKKVSAGFRKRDVRDVAVRRLGDDLLEASPKQDLEPGEYILVFGGARVQTNGSAGLQGTAYDFGIAPGLR